MKPSSDKITDAVYIAVCGVVPMIVGSAVLGKNATSHELIALFVTELSTIVLLLAIVFLRDPPKQ